jgi:orotate phosphoribosyltransferase-like protein
MTPRRVKMAQAAYDLRQRGATWEELSDALDCSRGTAQNLVKLAEAMRENPTIDPWVLYSRITNPRSTA